ncbi:MAG: hypothetical protein C0501_03185 [Isosphaera sp.]|nr:hypothetical protein [Isosphaera sp.]
MSHPVRARRWVALAALALATALPVGPNPRPADARPPAGELPDGLRFVPPDAALFLYADAAKVWDSPVLRSFRKADPDTFDFLTREAKKELGVVPEALKSVVLFAPRLKGPGDEERLGVVLTFTRPFDADLLQKGAKALLPKGARPKVVAADARTAVVLMNLGDEYAKPRPAADGPLAPALKAAAEGRHAAVLGMNPANLPDEVRGDDVPGPIRPVQPLFHALAVTATLDLDKDPTLDVRVKAATAGKAVECEKALGALLGLVQEEVVAGGLKEFGKDPALKDLAAVLKAAGAAAEKATFSTLGTETRVTVRLPADLPYGSAFAAARKEAQTAAAVNRSANNLRQIALAYHNYHDVHGAGPPAAVCDKDGKPILSWRVLILPYIEQEELYKEFKLDEPWDSDHNKKLLGKMPPVYAIPGQTKPGGTDTHYRVFVGNGAGWDWVKGQQLQQIRDGTSNTWMCVTAADAVPWTKPDELAFDPDKDMAKLVGAVVNGRAQVAMFDGSVRSLKKVPAKDVVKALVTRDGGEVIADDD